MCVIAVYHVIFPNGYRERRERLRNCSFGTPSRACRDVRYENHVDDRLATQADIIAAAEPRSDVDGPRIRSDYRVERPKKPKTAFDNLKIGFKIWNPFSSRRIVVEKAPKKRLTLERSRSDGKSRVVAREDPRSRSPRLPPPRPFMSPRMPPPPPPPPRSQSPVIIERTPRNEHLPQGFDQRGRGSRRRPPRVVEIHQSNDSDESASPPGRQHGGSGSQSTSSASRYEAEKALQREKERRQHAEHVAREEHTAHRRAVRAAEEERRRNDELERVAREQRRIRNEQRLRLESSARERARREREDWERRDWARRRQEAEDIEALRRIRHLREEQAEAERRARAHRAARLRQARHPNADRYDPDDFDERGERFIREAIRLENMRRFNRNAPDMPREHRRYADGGLRRRDTVDGARGYDDRWRRRWRPGHASH